MDTHLLTFGDPFFIVYYIVCIVYVIIIVYIVKFCNILLVGVTMIKLLYVDDDDTLLDLAKIFLESNDGIEVNTCGSALAALADHDLCSYDVIVSDYQMPDMDGIEFLKKVRSESNDLPFVLFTGRGREEVAIDAINLGADFYLQKGGDPRSQYFEMANILKQLVSKRRAEISVRENEGRMKAILNTSRDMIMVIDEKGLIEYANPSAERVLGYSMEELVNKKIRNFIYPGDHKIVDKMLVKFQNGFDEFNETIYRVRKKDRGCATLSCIGTAMPSDGTIRKAVINARDVTDKLMAKQREIEWRSLIKNMSEGVDDGIAIVQRGAIVYCNPSLQRMLGRPMDEIVHAPFTAFLDPTDAGQAMKRYHKRIRGVELDDFFDTTFISKDGRELQVTLYGHLINHEGMPANLVICKDNTMLNNAALTLNECKERFILLLDHMNDASAVYDIERDRWGRPSDLKMILANDRFISMFDKSKEDLIGVGLAQIFDPVESPIHQCLLDSISREEPLSMDLYYSAIGKSLSLSSFQMGKDKYVTIFSDLSGSTISEDGRLHELGGKGGS